MTTWDELYRDFAESSTSQGASDLFHIAVYLDAEYKYWAAHHDVTGLFGFPSVEHITYHENVEWRHMGGHGDRRIATRYNKEAEEA